jgi:hypothetical protein
MVKKEQIKTKTLLWSHQRPGTASAPTANLMAKCYQPRIGKAIENFSTQL